MLSFPALPLLFLPLFTLLPRKVNSRKSISKILHSPGPIGPETRNRTPTCWTGPHYMLWCWISMHFGGYVLGPGQLVIRRGFLVQRAPSMAMYSRRMASLAR